MILVDADVLLIDLRYPKDSRFSTNRKVLDHLKAGPTTGITMQALLEVVGVLSFNVSRSRIIRLPDLLRVQYGLVAIPDPSLHNHYAGCTFDELVAQMGRQMALGDAVQAVQIEQHGTAINCLLSWNARHFSGKLIVPALTPQDWLDQQNPPIP